MKKQSIYIAGPVSGHNIHQVTERFLEKERILQSEYITVNPVTYIQQLNAKRLVQGEPVLNDHNEVAREQILRHCVSLMVLCDEIYMLRGWQESEGATLERNIAMTMGKYITYE